MKKKQARPKRNVSKPTSKASKTKPRAFKQSAINKLHNKSKSSETNKINVLKNTAINSFTSDVVPTEEQILERMKILKTRAKRQLSIAKMHSLQMMLGLMGDEDFDIEVDDENDEDFAAPRRLSKASAGDLLDQFANEEEDNEDYDPEVGDGGDDDDDDDDDEDDDEDEDEDEESDEER